MNLKNVLYNEILPRVEKPSRYLGTELNSIHKNPNQVDLRIALAFPDLYDLGLGNVGVLILYAILNRLDWCWCERVYSPAPDMERELRARGLPMFASESKDSLASFDAVGYTLQSELTYTNILTLIDMTPMPLRSADRTDAHPLVFGGGPGVFNPEPIAPFFDFFVMGEGEEVIVEIAELLRGMKGARRREKLEALAQIEGVYVPALYPFETLEDGRIVPKPGAPKIRKRVVNNLDGALFPTNYVVPYTQQVHDRIALEVLRGCTQGCRFCQPGMVTRPVRERSLKNIDKLMEDTIAKTGYEEVSLLSLSTCDFSRPRMLVQQAAKRAANDGVSVSLPSLRLDSFSVELADHVAGVRRSGLTFAPEAASPRLRALINKWIPDEELLEMSFEAFKRNWTHVKCYFIIGLPTERDEDIEAIIDLCERVLERGKTVNPRAKVNLGVSTFVPKPFTPFQWAEQITMEETERRQRILARAFNRNPSIKFGRHEPATSWLEGLLSRADRRAADLIEAAWRRGARLESWDEHMNLEIWRAAIAETGFDEGDALRERSLDERLPWDHIDTLLDPEWLKQDWRNAMELKYAQDCRAGKCHLCGVIDKKRDLCVTMIKRQKAGRKEEANVTFEAPIKTPEPPAVQRLRFRIGRDGEARWLSNLEWINAWIRALRRARAPLSYSQGFHAHPKVNFASAPPVGEESTGDWMDIVLRERVEPAEMLARLKATLPEGFHAYEVEEVPLNAPALMAAATGYTYAFHATLDNRGALDNLHARIADILAAGEILVERKAKAKSNKGRNRGRSHGDGTIQINVRPMIDSIEVSSEESAPALTSGRTQPYYVSLRIQTRIAGKRSLRPRELQALLGLDAATTRVVKCETRLAPLESALPLAP